MPTSYLADTDVNGVVISYCQCNPKCDGPDIDDYGHCKHLIGFSADKKTYEPLKPLIRKGGEGMFDTGMKIVGTGMATPRQLKPQLPIPEDKENNRVWLVNPTGTQRLTQKQRGEGFTETFNVWHTWRVYQQFPAKVKEPELVGAK